MLDHRLIGFFDELEKLSYDVAGHTQLARPTASAMGASHQLGDLVTRGSLATDTGVRHPWLPTAHAEHAFPSQTKRQISQHLMKTQQQGVKDVASAIAKGGPLAGMRTTRGLMDIGQAQHGLMDIGAHYERPVARGMSGPAATTARGRAAGRAREVLQKIPGAGPLGFAVSGTEHQQAGLKAGHGMAPGSELDVFTGQTKGDVRSMGRASGFGRATKRDIIKQLQAVHGMTPEQASAAYTKYMAGPAPGRVSQALGRGTRDIRYVGQQAARPVKAVGSAARTIGAGVRGKVNLRLPGLAAKIRGRLSGGLRLLR